MTTERADLAARLFAGRNRTDIGNEVIEELGYAVYWWNSRENRDGGVTLSMHLNVTSQHVGNNVLLNFPDSSRFPSLYTTNTAKSILSAVISSFEPQRAVWSSSSLTREQAEPDEPLDGGGIAYGQIVGHPAGWATFLADDETTRFDRQALPKTATVERVGNSGSLVLVGDDPANPPLNDVLAVRAAMGYAVPHLDRSAAPSVEPSESPRSAALHGEERGAAPSATADHQEHDQVSEQKRLDSEARREEA
ncbi:hypothetical protein LV457_01465 [Mycobacterium sp. MYCO198283]|nr:hypothetical protein [Mycobacterium sp. MYCO198283]MCG5430966.1 hypothetical protein [Mycobacterium sp. MYCO198283]